MLVLQVQYYLAKNPAAATDNVSLESKENKTQSSLFRRSNCFENCSSKKCSYSFNPSESKWQKLDIISNKLLTQVLLFPMSKFFKLAELFEM